MRTVINKTINYIEENIYIEEINGLKIYMMPKKGFSKSIAQISTKYGSNDIKFSINNAEFKEYPLGIAHFLEHKLFEQEKGNIFEKFTALGSSPNAYTNYSETSYYFSSTSDFYENLKLLLEFVYNPYFTDENVEKEKGIIEQEIRMYEDNPGSKVYYNAVRCMYKNYPIVNDIAGTVESIKKITKELLYECYNAFYTPSNMQLVIVGDIDVDKTIEVLRQLVPKITEPPIVNRFKFENDKGIIEKQKTEEMKLSIPNFIIGFKDDYIQKVSDLTERKITGDILGRTMLGRSSELYEKLYNGGLINEGFEFDYTVEKDYAHFFIGGESRKPEKIKEVILEHLHNRKGLDMADVIRVKKAITGAYVGRFNSIDSIAGCMNEYYLKNLNLFNYLDILRNIDMKIMEKNYKEIIDVDNIIISVIK